MTVNPLLTKVAALRDSTNQVLVDLDEILDALLLAIIGRKNVFLLGQPGIAKSYLVDQLLLRIAGARLFKDQFHRTMTYDTVFGPLDVSEFKKGNYVRNTIGYSPDADIAVWDELFKASGTLLNGALMFLNERKFRNGSQLLDVPTTSVIGCSNEIPGEDREELAAMYDRLTIRLVVPEVESASAMRRLLRLDPPANPATVITWDEIAQAQAEAADVPVSDAAIEALIDIRRHVRDAGIRISPRRWRQAVQLFSTAAWLDGAAEAQPGHGDFLVHLLWDRPEQIRQIEDAVLKVIAPDRVEANKLRDDVLALAEEMATATEGDEPNLASLNELFSKIKRARKEVTAREAAAAGKTGRVYRELATTLDNLARQVAEGFGIDSDALKEGPS